MAHKRMFSKDITSSDAFREMPPSSQALYFHLGMEADDDGFLDNYKGLMRAINSSEDDIRILLSKRFLILFPSRIIVVKHWKINNTIQKDRYNQTKHLEEKRMLIFKENGSYTECIHDVSTMDTQDRIEEESIGEKRREKRPTPDKPESSLSWLGTFNEKEEFVCGVPNETLKAFSEKYKASEEQIQNKCEDLVLWAKTSRKIKKNYKTFLQVILKKDFGIRTEADKVLEERIRLTREHGEQSSPFAQELSKKMKM